MAHLPTPLTVTDEYLKAILAKQDEILAEIKKSKPAAPDALVELKEPGTKFITGKKRA